MMSPKSAGRSLVLLLALLASACAHPIKIVPDMEGIARSSNLVPVPKKVGYYIPANLKSKSVITAAGGGDKVEYTPYGDMDSGLFRVLSNVFSGGVYVVTDPSDAAFIKSKGISFLFRPEISTTSSSRNIMFWPPTDFSVTISCTAFDADGREVWKQSVTGDNGVTAVNATLHEHGLAGRLAAQDALQKLQGVMALSPVFR